MTTLIHDPATLAQLFALALLVSLFLAALAILGNGIGMNDRRAKAAGIAETFCFMAWFECARYVLAAKLNAAKVAR